MTADLSALIARLEAAEVGSRELGHEVLLALGWHRNQIGNFYGPLYQWSSPDHSPHLIRGDEDNLPNPALSLDAALALAERVLPGWNWTLLSERERLANSDDPRPYAGLKRRGPPMADEGYASASASTPALAFCIAILRAKQGEG